MRLIVVILIASLVQVSAATFGQRITIHQKNASLTAVLKEIRLQSGFDIFYDFKIIPQHQKVSIQLNNATIEEALNTVLKDFKFQYDIDGTIVTIKKKKEPSMLDQIISRFQEIEVRGKVLTENGEALAGATVAIKGSVRSVKTNEKGDFYLQNVAEKDKLLISYIGYETLELNVKADMGSLTMKIADSKLDEITVNAGYYTVKDKERTGSISKITSKEIGQQPVANPLAAMQGRMAGVHITQNSGTPGGGFDIQIRGRNSLRTEGNAPLFIVDGVPYPSQSVSDQSLSGLLFTMGNVSPLNSLNPNDIESIEVLKDADATAIYGSRGSNGVVLITTKIGSGNRTSFSIQSTTSISPVAKSIDLLNTEEYLKMRRDAFANDGITQYPANAYDLNGNWDGNRYTNWQKEFIGKNAVSQNYQLSVSGGSGQTNYLFSAGQRKDETPFYGDFGYNRTNFSLSTNHTSKNSRFSWQSNILKNSQKNELMATDFYGKIFLAPNAPSLFGADGELNWENNTFDNPLAALESQYFSAVDNFSAHVSLSYKVRNNVTLSLRSGLTKLENEEFKTIPNTIMNPSYGYTSAVSSNTISSLNRSGWIVEPKINWSHKTENGKWDALIGVTFEENKQERFSLRASNFLSNEFIFNLANAKTQQIIHDTEGQYRYIAAYGRLNYTYLDKYILNLTGRRDGSSRFGSNNRFANFGAVGAAWLFNKENIFENITWLTSGKLRASYGVAGSDLIGDYQYLNTYAVTSQKYDNAIALYPIKLFNPDFSWENTKKAEIAMELELFNGRIATSIAYYHNQSSNQLVGIPLPGTTGFNSVQANLKATVQNTAWELTFRTQNIKKKLFRWSTDFNMSIPKNKLVEFPNLEESTYANQYVIGKPITIKKVFNYLGVDRETGIYQFENVNNDGLINADDRTTVVNIGVVYFGGINNHFSLNKWSIDFLCQFVKQDNYNSDYHFNTIGGMANREKRVLNYYSESNKNAKYQKPTTGANTQAVQAATNFRNSNGVISDASFIRLKTFQLQYVLSNKRLKNSSLSIFTQGNNLLTITDFLGHDPETSGALLPATKTFALGFNFKF